MDKRHEVDGFAVEFIDMRQKQMSEFMRLRKEAEANNETVFEHKDATVRAAIQAGWFEYISERNVDEMLPWQVRWLYDVISAEYERVNTIPKN